MRIAVVGAGMAGLAAARRLTEAGHHVTVLDKGRRVGGRLSTKYFAGGGRADAGAQFFTVREAPFADAVARWQSAGLVHEWCRGFAEDDGYPRYVVRGGMSELAIAMAGRIEVSYGVRVAGVRVVADEVMVQWPNAQGHPASHLLTDAVIVTPPVPQAAELLGPDAGVPSIPYAPTLSLMVALDRPVRISGSGGRQLTDDATWAFIGDNQAKGTSALPVITFHSTPQVALAGETPGADPSAITDELLHAARPFLGAASVVEAQLQRWHYATPLEPYAERTLALAEGRIVLAGDAFGGPRVEGAFLSGLAAARRLDPAA